MRRLTPAPGLLCAVGVLGLVGARPAGAQANPDFDAVTWTPLTCAASPLTALDPRAEINLVGDAVFPAVDLGRDATYLYFRYRVDRTPLLSAGGFMGNSAWTMLLQTPSGDPFQYQYQLTLNGDGRDTVEVWKNDPATDLTFSPIFTDDSDTLLFSQAKDLVGAGIPNTSPLARAAQTTDGSDFRGTPDYFVDVAFPISVLIANGVIGSADDLAQALFFPATAAAPNRHDKDYLNCPFLPATPLTVGASVAPTTAPPVVATTVSYTFTVQNAGSLAAKGLAVTAAGLPPFVSSPEVTAAADDPNVTPTVVTADPPTVRVATLPPSATLTVQVSGTATFTCTSGATAVTASATNAVAASASVAPHVGVPEVCDGIDNDCDGQVDNGGNALCDDGNFCNGAETCAGAAGCQPGTPPSCDDGNPCTTDACDATLGCTHTPLPGCPPCTTPADCSDGNPCTTDACNAGSCTNTPIAGCVPCTAAAQCDDADRCTTDTCTAGVCAHAPVTTCPCVTAPEVCNDGIDNDCDGLVDCADPDCAGDPACAPPPEICGNCVDDNHNGLVDWEDPACCPQVMPLAVDRVTLRPPPARAHGDRLRLQAIYSEVTPALFDPLKQDTSLQLSDASGTFLCTTIPAARFRHTRRLVFTFSDRAARFGGLERVEFRINRRGNLLFRARGRGDDLRPVVGGTVRVTVRVGAVCARTTMALRTSRKGLVYP